MKNESKWYYKIPVKFFMNITFTKLVLTYIILVGIQTNNIELVRIGAYGLVGRKLASGLFNK
jgi:hypothetical protein